MCLVQHIMSHSVFIVSDGMDSLWLSTMKQCFFWGGVDVAVILHVFYSVGGQEREERGVIVRAVVLKKDLGFQK